MSSIESSIRVTGERRAQANGWRWLPVALVVIALDQATKLWVVQNFRLYQSVRVLPVLDFTLLFNPGASFNFLSDSSGLGFAGGALLIGSLIALTALAYRFTKTSHVALFWIAFVLTRSFWSDDGRCAHQVSR